MTTSNGMALSALLNGIGLKRVRFFSAAGSVSGLGGGLAATQAVRRTIESLLMPPVANGVGI